MYETSRKKFSCVGLSETEMLPQRGGRFAQGHKVLKFIKFILFLMW